MKLVIHDLTDAEFRAYLPERPTEWHTVSRTPSSHGCIGCLDCWFRLDGECPIRDNLCEVAELMAEADEIIVLSRCVYGCVSPFVKMVFDRLIASLRPQMELKGNETRFRSRVEEPPPLTVNFYGDATEEERKTAEDFLNAFRKFLGIPECSVFFYPTLEEFREVPV